MTIHYPANEAEWYAKGTAVLNDGSEIYFEVPAVFNADGMCDVSATDARVQYLIDLQNQMRP